MKKLWIFSVGFCLLATPMAYAAKMHTFAGKEEQIPIGPKIRVLLTKGTPTALIEAKGPYRVIDRERGEILSGGMVGKRYPMHGIQGGLRWGEEYPGVTHLTLVGTHADTTFFVNGFQYKGFLDLYLDRDHHLAVVNEVSIEDYVQSTVAVHISEELCREALAAYTIAARTEAYALSLIGKKSQKLWDVRARDVGYFGYGVTLQKNGVEQSIRDTRFMVLESAKGVPVSGMRVAERKLEELAVSGLNAKQMLQNCYPHTQLGVTAMPNPAHPVR